MHQIKATSPKSTGKFIYRPVLRLAFTLLLVLGVALTSTGLAAASSLPGESLYPVKLSIEETRLFVNQDDGREIQLRLRFASSRVGELQMLSQHDELEAASPALQNYQKQVAELGSALERVAATDLPRAQHLADQSAERLESLLSVLLEIRANVPDSVSGDFELVIEQTQTTLEQTQQFGREQNRNLDEEQQAGDSPEVFTLVENTPTPTAQPTASATPIVTEDTPTPEPSNTLAQSATPDETATSVATTATSPTQPANTPAPPAQAPTSPPAASDGNNKNDGKDNNPDDGNAGAGDDDKVQDNNKDGNKTTGQDKDKNK
ncbi:MAG: hypothetical protein H8E28_14580 [Anaerolineae bacterium]|nr:hypothetical protein [Anaerolineae bacterium]